MAISTNLRQLQRDSYVESTAVADQPALAVVGPDGSPAGGVEYNSTPPTLTNGQVDAFQGDAAANLKVTVETPFAGEYISEGSNGVQATARLPLSSSTFAWDRDVSAAYEASTVTKASPGRVRDITGYNSGSAQFLQIHNATSLPADTAVPAFLAAIPGTGNFTIDFGEDGDYFSTGIVVCNSSTGPTKTIGSADCWFNIRYK